MANKTASAANGVNLVVNPNAEVVEAFVNPNNTKQNLPKTDPKVITAVTNLNNSPAIKKALGVADKTIKVSPNYSPTGTTATTQAESSNTTPNTSNKNNDPFYGPIIKNSKSGNTEALIYPLDLSKDQDRMVITMYRYRNTVNNFISNRSPTAAPGSRDITKTDEGDGKPLSYIVLPMPNNLGDISKVEWGASTLPASQIAKAAIQSAIGSNAQSRIGQLQNLDLNSSDYNKRVDEIQTKEKRLNAISDGILNDQALTRFSGVITNPNQDLLFTGNGLRNFTYSFDLYPRNSEESKEIRKIVRTLRQGMLPRKIGGGVLVGAPNVFRIRFLKGGTDEPLKDVRRHKELALTSFVADPSPGDIWMTYNDSDHSTIGFKILMQFTELVPIYYNDFVDEQGNEIKDINGDSIQDSIGY